MTSGREPVTSTLLDTAIDVPATKHESGCPDPVQFAGEGWRSVLPGLVSMGEGSVSMPVGADGKHAVHPDGPKHAWASGGASIAFASASPPAPSIGDVP